LIQELGINSRSSNDRNEKNIRRRVYDALNVLIAAEVVMKKGRNVTWAGQD